MRSRYQKLRLSITGETNATNPGHANRWRIEMDGIEIESSERLQFEPLPQMLARAIVVLINGVTLRRPKPGYFAGR